jgi:acyl transferase domain-containing protein
MTDVAAGDLSPIKRALVEIRELRSRVAQLEGAHREPIAIVGMGMRLPGGVRDAAGYERLLWEGMDAITPIPTGRWSLDEFYDPDPDAPGKMPRVSGGFLDGRRRASTPQFFGIAPREADQHGSAAAAAARVAWEALEDAGIAPDRAGRLHDGVYLGMTPATTDRAASGPRAGRADCLLRVRAAATASRPAGCRTS